MLNLSVSKDKLRYIALQFLGESVEVEILHNEQKEMLVKDIRWAA